MGGRPLRAGRAKASLTQPAPLRPQTSCLQYLDARSTPLLDHSAPFVARALRIRSSLTVLHLENASLSGRPLTLLGEPQAGGWAVACSPLGNPSRCSVSPGPGAGRQCAACRGSPHAAR